MILDAPRSTRTNYAHPGVVAGARWLATIFYHHLCIKQRILFEALSLRAPTLRGLSATYKITMIHGLPMNQLRFYSRCAILRIALGGMHGNAHRAWPIDESAVLLCPSPTPPCPTILYVAVQVAMKVSGSVEGRGLDREEFSRATKAALKGGRCCTARLRPWRWLSINFTVASSVLGSSS